MIEITGNAPVVFKDGYPVFEPYVVEHGTVRLTKMLGDERDFAPADRVFAKRHGKLKADGTPNQTWAEKYRKDSELTWHHHQDGRTMLLVPAPLHGKIPHAGGASLIRSQQKTTQEPHE